MNKRNEPMNNLKWFKLIFLFNTEKNAIIKPTKKTGIIYPIKSIEPLKSTKIKTKSKLNSVLVLIIVVIIHIKFNLLNILNGLFPISKRKNYKI